MLSTLYIKKLHVKQKHAIQCVSKQTGPLQLISYNFSNSQRSLIIFFYPRFKVTIFFNVKYLENGTRFRYITTAG